MSRTRSGEFRIAALAAVLLAAAGCIDQQARGRPEVEIKGSNPAAPTAPATTAPVPDANGIVNHDGYQAAVARPGDTVASLAHRIGLSASALGAYNGLSPTHPLRVGDELVLPPRPGGYSANSQPQPAYRAAPAGAVIAPAGPPPVPIEATPLDGAAAAPGASSGPVWSPDIAAAAIERATGIDDRGRLTVPPSAVQPLPPDPEPLGELKSPQLRQYQTPAPESRPVETIATPLEEAVETEAATELAMAAPVEPVPFQPVRPVETVTAPVEPVPFKIIRPVRGPVVIGFNQGFGRSRNDGIEFASPANSPVVAAAAGEVALVSQSLGGLGTIVLVRHPGEYITVYGRIEQVIVAKGDIVRKGQKIGVVSPAVEPRMHFEVRRGAQSMDPMKFM